MTAQRFGPEGTVWSSTIVHLDGVGPPAPYQLAYLDLDRGPRVLVQVDSEPLVAVGSRLRLDGKTAVGGAVAVPA